jgi:hypothetical protein
MATIVSSDPSWNGSNPWGLTAKVGPYKATRKDKLNFFNRQGGPNAGHADAFYVIRPAPFVETKQPKGMGYYADHNIIDNYDYSVQSTVPGRRGKKASFKDNFNIEAHNQRLAIELKNQKETANANYDLEQYRNEVRNYNMASMSKFINADLKTDTKSDASMQSPSMSSLPSSSSSPMNPTADATFRPEIAESPSSNGSAMSIDGPSSGYGMLYNGSSGGARRGLNPINTNLGNI